jgi:hypothetical protein
MTLEGWNDMMARHGMDDNLMEILKNPDPGWESAKGTGILTVNFYSTYQRNAHKD